MFRLPVCSSDRFKPRVCSVWTRLVTSRAGLPSGWRKARVSINCRQRPFQVQQLCDSTLIYRFHLAFWLHQHKAGSLLKITYYSGVPVKLGPFHCAVPGSFEEKKKRMCVSEATEACPVSLQASPIEGWWNIRPTGILHCNYIRPLAYGGLASRCTQPPAALCHMVRLHFSGAFWRDCCRRSNIKSEDCARIASMLIAHFLPRRLRAPIRSAPPSLPSSPAEVSNLL